MATIPSEFLRRFFAWPLVVLTSTLLWFWLLTPVVGDDSYWIQRRNRAVQKHPISSMGSGG